MNVFVLVTYFNPTSFNVGREKRAIEEWQGETTAGGGGDSGGGDEDYSDDDAEWYRREVGEEPEQELFANSARYITTL